MNTAVNVTDLGDIRPEGSPLGGQGGMSPCSSHVMETYGNLVDADIS